MKKQMGKGFAMCLAVSLLMGCSAGGTAVTEATETDKSIKESALETVQEKSSSILNLGTGSVGGTDNVVIEAISSVVNAKTSLRTSTVTTSGGAEIIYLLEEGSVQGGYTGTIDLVNALNGDEPFESPVAQENMLQGFGFVTWALPIVVLESSSIQEYADLEGKHIGLPPAASSTTAVLNLVLEAYGLTDKVKVDYFTWSEGYTALKDGRIDAFVGSYANGSPISGLVEIEATNAIRVLDMDPAIGEKVKAMNGGVGVATLTTEQVKTIPADEKCLAPANSGVIIFSASVPEDDIYQYTKATIENLNELQQLSAYFEGFHDVATKVCVESVPFHPGAAKALKEAGLWEERFSVYEN